MESTRSLLRRELENLTVNGDFLFELSAAQIDRCVDAMEEMVLDSGEFIFCQSDPSDHSGYFLTHGRLRLSRSLESGGNHGNDERRDTDTDAESICSDGEDAETEVFSFENGGHFGTHALVCGCRRTWSLKVVSTTAHVWRLRREAFEAAMNAPLTCDELLASHPVFCVLDVNARQKLASLATSLQADKGEVLERRGEVCTQIYFVQTGEVWGMLCAKGVGKILGPQQHGEVLWCRTSGECFGEDVLAIDSRFQNAVDVVVARPGTIIFAIKHSDVLKFINEAMETQLRTHYVSQLLRTLHAYSDLSYALIKNHVALESRSFLLENECNVPASNLEANFEAPSGSRFVILNGTLKFDVVEHGIRKTVGRLETGQSFPFARLANTEMTVEVASNSWLMIVPDRPKQMIGTNGEEGSSVNDTAMSLAVSPKLNIIALKRQLQRADSLKRRRSQVLNISMTDIPATSSDESVEDDERLRLGSPKKTKKQLAFLEGLSPLKTEHVVKRTNAVRAMAAASPHRNGTPASQNNCESFIRKAQSLSPFPSCISPKKRSTGLVLSLDSLEVLETLGQGAFGTVSLVRDRESNYIYALKQLEKTRVVRKKQQVRVQSEKCIMEKFGQHSFVTSFVRSFQDDSYVYLLLECGLGGDLFDLIEPRHSQSLTKEEMKFFYAQIVLAVEHLHRCKVIYRDLKPENCVLCVDGYLRITDFGMAKELSLHMSRTFTLCGTPTFIAPETATLQGYNTVVDWWAFGILCFELATGAFPFSVTSVAQLKPLFDVYSKEYPNAAALNRMYSLSSDADLHDLIRSLLHPNPILRLGAHTFARDASEVKRHPYFADVDFVGLENHHVEPPQSILDAVRERRILKSITQGGNGARFGGTDSLRKKTGDLNKHINSNNTWFAQQSWELMF